MRVCVMLPRAGFVIFSYVIDTQVMFQVAVFVLAIVATEWAGIAAFLPVGLDESDTEECALEDLTDAQKAALSAMAAAFNESCANQATVLLGWTHR